MVCCWAVSVAVLIYLVYLYYTSFLSHVLQRHDARLCKHVFIPLSYVYVVYHNCRCVFAKSYLDMNPTLDSARGPDNFACKM